VSGFPQRFYCSIAAAKRKPSEYRQAGSGCLRISLSSFMDAGILTGKYGTIQKKSALATFGFAVTPVPPFFVRGRFDPVAQDSYKWRLGV
jgi:hypothetical protein